MILDIQKWSKTAFFIKNINFINNSASEKICCIGFLIPHIVLNIVQGSPVGFFFWGYREKGVLSIDENFFLIYIILLIFLKRNEILH